SSGGVKSGWAASSTRVRGVADGEDGVSDELVECLDRPNDGGLAAVWNEFRRTTLRAEPSRAELATHARAVEHERGCIVGRTEAEEADRMVGCPRSSATDASVGRCIGSDETLDNPAVIARSIAAALIVGLGAFVVFAVHMQTRTFPRPPVAVGTSEVTCQAPNILAAVLSVLVEVPGVRPAPEPGSIPPGFVPVRVVVCMEGAQPDVDAAHAPAVEETIREGDLSAVMVALSRPSQPKSPFSLSDCALSLGRPAVIWLVNAAGIGIRPAVPTERSCGQMSADPFIAINALPIVERRIHNLDVY
ncbi:hypothetical protein R3Q06_35700, partial [Rhodococcus erythropolis]|uniref:hypothetical protein n=1 Tax=Rhodococcus erythropolis TaxID=1833 RepID=UPI002948CF50